MMSKNIKEFFENKVVRMILLIFEEYQRTLAFQKIQVILKKMYKGGKEDAACNSNESKKSNG